MAGRLELREVTKSYGEAVVLDQVSLAVDDGEVVALIGSSGSGKSTLLRCVNLLEPIDDGAILLDGDDISEPGRDPDPIRRRIGMVFQSYNLFPHMKVLDNVTLGPRKVLKEPRGAARARAVELLRRFGLGERARGVPRPALRGAAAARGAGAGDGHEP